VSVEARLKKIEEQFKTGDCVCVPQRSGIWHRNCWRGDDCDTAHKPPPDRCDLCGGEITSLQIIYIEDWRSAWNQ
jgi:hypothetical protein